MASAASDAHKPRDEMCVRAPQSEYFERQLRRLLQDHEEAVHQLIMEACMQSFEGKPGSMNRSTLTESSEVSIQTQTQIIEDSEDLLLETSRALAVDVEVPPAKVPHRHATQCEDVAALEYGASISDIRSYVQRHTIYNQVREHSQYDWLNGVLEVCQNLKEPERTGVLNQAIESSAFKVGIFLGIISNCIYTVFTTDWEMKNIRATKPPFMTAMELAYLCFFLIEVVLKLLVHRCYFFVNKDMHWNIFDFVLVLFSASDQVLSFFGRVSYSLSIGRMIRLLKVAQVLRAMRMLQFVSELRLMVDCLLGSLISLLWSFSLLALIKLLFSIMLVQQMANFLSERGSSISQQQESDIIEAFGSVLQAMLSLFMGISGGRDWVELYRLTQLAGNLAASMFICYMLFMWLSVTNVITSIFVEKAMKLARPELEEKMLESCKEDLASVQELMSLFKSMHMDKTHTLTLDEFHNTIKDIRVQSYFALKGISVSQVDMLFKLLMMHSPHDGVDLNSFVTGCLRMRGYAINIDVIALCYRTQSLSNDLQRYIEEYRTDTSHLRRLVRKLEESSSYAF